MAQGQLAWIRRHQRRPTVRNPEHRPALAARRHRRRARPAVVTHDAVKVYDQASRTVSIRALTPAAKYGQQ